ncbi:hypothetical protein O181_004079 [Austropuccinia psidii MF-1]|uniref:Uncharacterized protein n=1 Tax=Austropuccinia psidii MF-1 TaxID=1389203 RepID=A0A9Q3GEH3_9BASI|nr:hypothetical protein [Austropuccinia psidii MF-1]
MYNCLMQSTLVSDYNRLRKEARELLQDGLFPRHPIHIRTNCVSLTGSFKKNRCAVEATLTAHEAFAIIEIAFQSASGASFRDLHLHAAFSTDETLTALSQSHFL